MAAQEGNCLLKISNTEYLTKFLHECVDDLIGRKRDSHYTYSSDIEWTPSETQRARHLIQNVFKRAVLGEDITSKFKELSPKDNAEILECFELRKDDIYQVVVKEKLLESGHPLVENVDWKLKWVIGSSKLASLSEPLLQVDLHCLQGAPGDGDRSSVNFEMNLAELDRFIAELKTAKANL